MEAEEVPVLAEWARQEGWNPGRADVGIAWELDPDAFIALRRDGELVGGGATIAYGGAFGFMGLFIVRADLRGGGLGAALWRARRDLLIARLSRGATIGMDGVFAMVPFYARGGFVLAHRTLRFDATGLAGDADPALADLATTGPADVVAYLSGADAANRPDFLRRWLAQPGARSAAAVSGGRIIGFGMTRPCTDGVKIGPLIADDAATARRIAAHLIAGSHGGRVQLDIPEPNTAGLCLATDLGMTESFGCARMYRGPAPDLPLARIYGITSFEFG